MGSCRMTREKQMEDQMVLLSARRKDLEGLSLVIVPWKVLEPLIRFTPHPSRLVKESKQYLYQVLTQSPTNRGINTESHKMTRVNPMKDAMDMVLARTRDSGGLLLAMMLAWKPPVRFAPPEKPSIKRLEHNPPQSI